VVESESEQAIWLVACAGDGEAFATLFDRHGDRVYRHARHLTASVVDAEDVVAATFFELWRRRRSVRIVEGSVLPWLLVTATNVSRNLSRGLRRYRTMLASLPRSSNVPGADELASERIHQEEALVLVQQALRALKPKDAALVALTTFEDLTPAEAAQVLGISAGNARTRLHRARAQMAKELGSTPEGIPWGLGWEGTS
jgi:RNA polymerase sigma factor (sigma-70 family)